MGGQLKPKLLNVKLLDLKKIIAAFDPREVVIDGNGLGLGLCDEMIHPHYDSDEVLSIPPMVANDADYKKIQPKEARQIIYVLKANGPLNSKIHGNCYARIASGSVHFLIKEQEAKNRLMATKVGQKMTVEQRVKRLMPHEMTTRLFEEMANLRLKRTGTGLDIILEQINSRYPKDKFSSFEYGLWRIKELEEEFYKKKRRRTSEGSSRRLVFFSEG